MADLAEKLGEEQQQFIRAQWLDAEDAERFRHMDPRVEAQLQVIPLPALLWAQAHAQYISLPDAEQDTCHPFVQAGRCK